MTTVSSAFLPETPPSARLSDGHINAYNWLLPDCSIPELPYEKFNIRLVEFYGWKLRKAVPVRFLPAPFEFYLVSIIFFVSLNAPAVTE
jgi:hypothetical protein